jgi:hypothetical protein
MAGLRNTTAMGAALCALLAVSAAGVWRTGPGPVVEPVAESVAEPVAVTEAQPAPLAAAEPSGALAELLPPAAEAPIAFAPMTLAPQPGLAMARVPDFSSFLLVADLGALTRTADPFAPAPTRIPLAGTPDISPAPAAPTGMVVPRSSAELLAERRGLDINDVRVQMDLRPAAVTFWIGTAAQDGILRDIATSPWNADWGADTFYGVSYSHRLGRFWRDFAVDIEAGGGYRAGSTNTPEAWGALYVRYDGFPWRNRLYTSFGLSTGLDWVNRLPESETGTPQQPEPNTTKVLHYFSPEFAFALPHYPEHELVLRYSHRSGIFGTFNGVWEGSNVLMLGYRRRL